MITCLNVLCTLQQHILELKSKVKHWLNNNCKFAKTTVVRSNNHSLFILPHPSCLHVCCYLKHNSTAALIDLPVDLLNFLSSNDNLLS